MPSPIKKIVKKAKKVAKDVYKVTPLRGITETTKTLNKYNKKRK